MSDFTIVMTYPMPMSDAVFAEHRSAVEEYLASTPFPGGHRFHFQVPESKDPGELEELMPEADFLLVVKEEITEKLIGLGKHLRLIQKLGTFYKNIDVEFATKVGVPVSVIPHFWAVTVAEHTILMMLALGKRLVSMHLATVAGENPHSVEPIYTRQWERRFNWLGLGPDVFVQLYERTLGIIGLGEIGAEVARRARCFEMEILYNNRSRLTRTEERRLGVKFRSLSDLLRESDFVSLHFPHTSETEKMIGADELALMKPTAFLINTARGNIVDQAALVDALKEGAIAGAALDVFSVEPPLPEDPLLSLDNVILTPHIAGRGPIFPRYRGAFENIARTLMGKRPKGLINPQVYA